jgi:hypothetical protein
LIGKVDKNGHSMKNTPNFVTVPVKLSARGLANIQEKEEYNDFEFIVGESRYRCPWFIADFLSLRIAQLHLIDNTISSFVIDRKTRNVNSQNFFHSVVVIKLLSTMTIETSTSRWLKNLRMKHLQEFCLKQDNKK